MLPHHVATGNPLSHFELPQILQEIRLAEIFIDYPWECYAIP